LQSKPDGSIRQQTTLRRLFFARGNRLGPDPCRGSALDLECKGWRGQLGACD